MTSTATATGTAGPADTADVRFTPPRPPTGRRLAFAAAVLALAALPWLVGEYPISLASSALVLALLAMSVNLLTGVTGLPTLGQTAYFGVGAYTAGLVAKHVSPVGLVQLAAAVLVAAAVAAATGTVAVRARGIPFLMLTLAIGELAFTAADKWERVTGGSNGLSGIPEVVPVWGAPPIELDGLLFYYVLGWFLVLYAVVAAVVRSPFGLSLRGIRDNEARMRATGYPVNRYLLSGYTVAGALAGAAGGLLVSLDQFVSPGDLGFTVAAMALIAVIIGGVGSMWGAVVGAGLVIGARDYLGPELQDSLHIDTGIGPLVLGALFIICVYLTPRGVAGVRLARLRRLFRSGRGAP